MTGENFRFPNGTWLMCRPDHFDVSYEINPWMKVTQRPNSQQAWRQWLNLHHTMIRLGAWIEYIAPIPGQPDMVFTANAGLVRGNKFVLSAFRYAERQGEAPGFKKWFEANGFDVHVLSQGSFEGEGDALFSGNDLYLGHGFRSDPSIKDEISQFLKITSISTLQLVDPYYYHLDTCFCPLQNGKALYYSGAFSKDAVSTLKNKLELFDVPAEEAKHFACNAVILGSDIILPAECPQTCNYLRANGFTPHEVELTEFIKSGGAAKCLTNRIK